MWPAIPLVLLAAGAIALSKASKAQKAKAPLITLEGSEWGLNTGGDAFIAFKQNGELLGFGGCNNIFGNYTQAGQTLTIGPLAMTKKFCPDEAESERRFIQALEHANRFEGSHIALKILDQDGDVILSLKRRDWD